MLHIIAALASDRGIGYNGDLVFHLREDLRRFKKLTMGHTLIMGRKTFDSLPSGALPGRRNIVITRQQDFAAKDVDVAHSLDEALAMAKDAEEVFIMGGASIYDAAINRADILDLTLIEATAPADTFFPQFQPDQWQLVDIENANTTPPAKFATFKRRF